MTIHELEKSDNILFKCIAGSKAFGLDTAASDTDIKGVFYLPKDKFYGIDYIPQISNETNDIVYYELGRFVELLLKIIQIYWNCLLLRMNVFCTNIR